MSAAERDKINDDTSRTLDTINWAEEGETLKGNVLPDPGSELAEGLGPHVVMDVSSALYATAPFGTALRTYTSRPKVASSLLIRPSQKTLSV